MFLFEKIGKNVQFNSLFLGIPKILICICVKQMAFLSEDWKKLFVWSSVPFTVFALEMRKREAYKKQAGSNVSALLNKVFALDHEWFMQGSPYWKTLVQN